MGGFEKKKHSEVKRSVSNGEHAQSDLSLDPPAFNFGPSSNSSSAAGASVIQQKGKKAYSNTISKDEAKKIIVDQTTSWGTDEAAVWNAIRKCNNRRGLMADGEVLSALKAEMEGHDLWKCYLLLEYGSESNFPQPINDLWNATSGAGTNEKGVFSALGNMTRAEKKSFGLSYILHWELSGKDLEKAMNLIVAQDSVQENLFGGNKGEEKLEVTEDSLRKLIDIKFEGAGSNGLKNAMNTLYSEPTGEVLNNALAQVEASRGLAKGTAIGQYNKAMKKKKEGVQYYIAKKKKEGKKYDPKKDNPSPALDTSEHGDFTASNAQLTFGKILGDVFGIDAVFGSLISPTGGMAGPGNERIPLIDDGSAVATHGAMHDAAGYLYNCHGIGPGYDYLQREVGSDPGNPLAGQTNIDWWIKEYKKRGKSVGHMEKLLNSKAYIGAAFAKQYELLNISQRKNALKVICETNTLTLKIAGISNTDRVSKVKELMKVSNASEKTQLADYYYNNNGFGSVLAASAINKIMKPHATPKVYQDYVQRQMDKVKHRGPYY